MKKQHFLWNPKFGKTMTKTVVYTEALNSVLYNFTATLYHNQISVNFDVCAAEMHALRTHKHR